MITAMGAAVKWTWMEVKRHIYKSQRFRQRIEAKKSSKVLLYKFANLLYDFLVSTYAGGQVKPQIDVYFPSFWI